MNLEIILVRTVLVLTAALSVGISLWGGYYLLTGLMSWRRPMDYGRHPAGTRFAVLIAARNEELVIGPLINSLLEQEYPAELYDIYVIPNNCTDNTALAARQFGAEVLECTVPVRSKGEVLRFAEEQLSGRHYDAFCVFDADQCGGPVLPKGDEQCISGRGPGRPRAIGTAKIPMTAPSRDATPSTTG